MKKVLNLRLFSIACAFLAIISILFTNAFSPAIAEAVSADYPAVLLRISTHDNSNHTSLYNYGGAAETAKMHCYADTAKTSLDNTHLSHAGALKIARMIAEETKKIDLKIGDKLR